MMWAKIEGGEIVSLITANEEPPDCVPVPEGLNPFKMVWDGEGLKEAPAEALEAERAIANREYRNQLLTASDWTQLPDAPADQEAWASYRQALRDLPNHVKWPNLDADDWPQVEEK